MLVNVAVRVRPPRVDGTKSAVKVSNDSHMQVNGRKYTYPSSVIEGSDQVSCSEKLTGWLLDRHAHGYSCALMAYGQTSSGKTHTVFGEPGSLTETALHGLPESVPPAPWGVFPRVALHLLSNRAAGTSCRLTAVEIYDGKVFDLLNERSRLHISQSRRKSLNDLRIDVGNGEFHPAGCLCPNCKSIRAREAKKLSQREGEGTSEEYGVIGATLVTLASAVDVARIARQVEITRVASSHNLNDRSSRSHCIIQMHIEKDLGNGKLARSRFVFVDLAGSERVFKSGVEGQRKSEALAINSSLTTLGRVINALAKRTHVPYRDSTLTKLLKPVISGRSCTSFVINVSSDEEYVDETISSLEFGQRLASRQFKQGISGTNSSSALGEIVDRSGEQEELQSRLEAALGELEELRKVGMGGGIDPSAVPTDKKMLLENIAKLEHAKRAVVKLQSGLNEAKMEEKMAQAGTSFSHLKSSSKIASELERAREVVEIQNGIVLRQKTIAGLWVEPTNLYKAKEREVKQLRSRMLS